MPRPKPLVSLHGSVNFDKLVPFDSAPNAPPLAANDILVMRKAAGGDNLTLSIGDITATGSVDIANLIGGNNNDMLYKNAGVWSATGPVGLSYDGFSMILNNDNLNFQGTSQVFSAGSGNWTQSSTGNIVQSGTGNIEVSGSGNLVVSGTGQILAPFASAAAPGFAFNGDADTGFYRSAGNRVAVAVGGIGTWEYRGVSFEGMIAGGPALENIDSTGVVPNVLPNRSDLNTGLGSSGLDNLSLIAGGVEIARAKEAVNDNQFLVIPGDDNTPGLSFIGDEDTGWRGTLTNQISAICGGNRAFHFTSTEFFSQFSNGPAIENAAAGIAAVNIRPDRSDTGTGLSADTPNMGLVANNNLIATCDGTNDRLVLNGAGGLVTTGGGGSGPLVKNEGATGTNPVFCPNQADPDTGFTRSGVNQSSIVNGGVEALRLRPTTSVAAASSNLLVWSYDDTALRQIAFGADDSAGVGFKLCRVAN